MSLLEHKVAQVLSKFTDSYSEKKYLLAVSGGSDSTCMIYALKNLNITFEMAHCNFQLRGVESDEDENFIRKLSKSLLINLHVKSFNTKEIVSNNKTSIQEEARNLRYSWFKAIISEFDLDYIITAHHLNDSIETFFINAIRGSGLEGLKGIPIVNDNIIRPFSTVTKEEINNYITFNAIEFRDDSSNQSLKYSRNYLRNKVIPKLDNVHPNPVKGLIRTIDNIRDTQTYLSQKISEDVKRLVEVHTDFVKITLGENPSAFILFHIVKEYGFNKTQLSDLLEAKKKGASVESNNSLMLKEDGHLLIYPMKKQSNEIYTFDSYGTFNIPIKITFEEVMSKGIIFQNNIAYFDAQKVKFPFVLRKWKHGDSFIPFGMNKKKKISDFFVNLKLNKVEKEKIWILENNGSICWVIGKRIDDRFKITKNTTKVLKIVTNYG